MGKFTMFFNHSKCSGCLLCEMACSLQHFGVTSRSKSYIRIVTNDTVGTSMALVAKNAPECYSCGATKICNMDALKIVPIESLGEFLKKRDPQWVAATTF